MNRREMVLSMLGTAALMNAPVRANAQANVTQLNSIIYPEPATLILGLNLQAPTQTVAGKIYQGLLSYDFDLTPRGELAKSWTVSPDGKAYTFRLQENVLWHDGRPFTSADVVFSTKTFLPAVHPIARNNLAKVEDVLAPDPLTVVFMMKEPFAPFIMGFAVGSAPMMPRHIYEGTEYSKNPANETPIGTGPFKLKEWRRGQYIHLVRNERYWKPDSPQLADIYYRVIPDSASRALALENKSVDLSAFGDIEPFDVPRLLKMPHLAHTAKGYEYFSPLSWIEINHRVGPLGDKRFRQALLHAVDRNFIRDKIFFGQGKVATGPISSTTRFYDGNVRRYDYDPRKAESILDSMGLKRKPSGSRIDVKLLALPYGERWTRTAEYIRQALTKVGIQTTLETVDAGTWGQRVANWDYEMTFDYLYQYGDPAVGVARTYITPNIRKGVLFTNTMGYSNTAVDDLFAKAAVTLDPKQRQGYYSEVQKLLVEDVPVAWLLELQFPTIYNREVQDLVTSAIGVNDSFDRAHWKAA